MSEKVQDSYDEDEFEGLLESARMNAANDWEEKFVADLQNKFDLYGKRMFISELQQQHIERIADDE